VDTYTSTWGVRAAPAVWLGALAAAAGLAWLAARPTGAGPIVAIALLVLFTAAAFPALCFLRRATSSGGKHVEAASGLWTLAAYLLLGFGPLLAA
jgi:hypothetical protein